ncbi:MAG: hypothetical protein M1832_005589 [Thelocarpon impressellum]|nr:MAG: hypothetical protein M1832_005589 [Thelocarpon impressellum]
MPPAFGSRVRSLASSLSAASAQLRRAEDANRAQRANALSIRAQAIALTSTRLHAETAQRAELAALAHADAVAALRDELCDSVREELRRELWAEVREELRQELWGPVLEELQADAGGAVRKRRRSSSPSPSPSRSPSPPRKAARCESAPPHEAPVVEAGLGDRSGDRSGDSDDSSGASMGMTPSLSPRDPPSPSPAPRLAPAPHPAAASLAPPAVVDLCSSEDDEEEGPLDQEKLAAEGDDGDDDDSDDNEDDEDEISDDETGDDEIGDNEEDFSDPDV